MDANRYLNLKENLARASAETIHDLRRIVKLGTDNNFQVILLEIPVICTQEWNRLQGHPSPEEFREQDRLIQRDIQLVNEEIRKINVESGKVSPMFNVDLKRKRQSSSSCYFNFSQFKDGVHPDRLLSKYWLRKLAELVLLECY